MGKTTNLKLIIIPFFVILTFFPNISIAQNTNVKNIFDILVTHSENGNLDSVFVVAQKLNKLSKAQSLLYYQAQSNYFFGRYYMNIGSVDSSIYYLQKCEKQFVQLNDTSNIGKAKFLIGANYNSVNNANKALSYFTVGANWLHYTGDSVWISIVNNYIGITYFEIGDYNQALKYIQISLDYLHASHDTISIGNTYNTIGNIYRKMHDSKNEELAYLQAIEILEKTRSSYQLGMVYSNLAEVYFMQKNDKLGFKTLDKVKEISEALNYPLLITGYYSVLSYYYTNSEPPDYKKVIEYSNKWKKIAKNYNDIRQFADASFYLGNALFKTLKLDKAENVSLAGFKIAKENMLANEIVKNSLLLAQVYESKKQSAKALLYYKIHYQYQDSLYNKEKIREFTILDLNYKFNQKQLSDSLQNAMQNEKTKLAFNAEIKNQQLYNYFYLFVTILVILIAVYLYYSAVRRKKANQVLSEQKQQITEQKTEIEDYANQVNNAFVKLKELDKFKQTFTSMLVHDVKTPLNTLINIDVFDNEQERMDLVKINSIQILNLVMNMLDINRTDENKINPILKNINLLDTIKISIKETNLLAKQKNTTFNINIQNNFSIVADKQLLVRVFSNIITNAIKFSPNGGEIIINTGIINDDKLRVSIIDQGFGISKEHHELIFEKYKQVNQKKLGSINSTGLGLAFCKLAIKAHNWAIGVDSREGEGACFWIDINEFIKLKESIASNNINNITSNNIHKPQISDEDNIRLKPYLLQLEKLQVFAVSDVKSIIEKIRGENIPGLNNWIEQILDSVKKYDNKKYVFLIKLFIN